MKAVGGKGGGEGAGRTGGTIYDGLGAGGLKVMWERGKATG